MENIIAQLGLDPAATLKDVITEIIRLQKEAKGKAEAVEEVARLKEEAKAKGGNAAREKEIQQKMAAGLSREVAIEALDNQAREDAAREKGKKEKK